MDDELDTAISAAISASATDMMKGKIVAKVTVTAASERNSGEVYGSITIHFTDDTVFVVSEGGQAGYMDYLICLPPLLIEGDSPLIS